MSNLDKAVVRSVRWLDALPERLRGNFLERLKDPHIYSLRSEIALNDLYVERLLGELGLYGSAEAIPPVEEEAWAKLRAALELRTKMVAQEVRTLEVLAQHGARQAERAEALSAIVVEVLRQRVLPLPEGKRILTEVADELGQRVRELQGGQ